VALTPGTERLLAFVSAGQRHLYLTHVRITEEVLSDACIVERDGPVLVVTLNRPKRLNALTQAMQDELEGIWNAYFDDPELRVAILTGSGERAFCAGSDLVAFEDGGRRIHFPAHGYAGLTHRLGRSKPIIAALNGLAYGGGFELVLACDLVIACEHTEVALPEVKLGAAAIAGGIPWLVRRIGYTAAMSMLLTGRAVSAAEALRMGLVNAVVPKGTALAAAKEWAGQIAQASPLAIELTLEVAERSIRVGDLREVLDYEQGEPRRRMLSSSDLGEGVLAFIEKRSPVWQGR